MTATRFSCPRRPGRHSAIRSGTSRSFCVPFISVCILYVRGRGPLGPLRHNSAVPINYDPAIPLHVGQVHRRRFQIDIDE